MRARTCVRASARVYSTVARRENERDLKRERARGRLFHLSPADAAFLSVIVPLTRPAATPSATPFNNNNNRAGLAAVGRRRGMWTGGGRQREGVRRRRGKERCQCGRVWVTRRPCHVRFQPQPSSSSTGPPRVSTSSRDVGSSSDSGASRTFASSKKSSILARSALSTDIYLFLITLSLT